MNDSFLIRNIAYNIQHNNPDCNINKADLAIYGQYLTRICAKYGNLQAFEILIKLGVNIELCLTHLIELAASGGYKNMLIRLLDIGIADREIYQKESIYLSALHWVVKSGDIDCLRTVLATITSTQNYSDIQIYTRAINIAIKNHFAVSLELLIEHSKRIVYYNIYEKATAIYEYIPDIEFCIQAVESNNTDITTVLKQQYPHIFKSIKEQLLKIAFSNENTDMTKIICL